MRLNRKPVVPNFKGERVISLKQAVHLDVFTRKPSYAKLKNWCTRGCFGIFLRSRQEGREFITSIEEQSE